MDRTMLWIIILASIFTICISQTSAPTGCAGPPLLCCSGHNSSCNRGCFCDEICVQLRDCCSDYNSSCGQTNTTSGPNQTTTPQTITGNTTAPLNTSQGTSNATSPPPGGSTSTDSPASPDRQKYIAYLKINVETTSGENQATVFNSVSNFVSHDLLRMCRGCTFSLRLTKIT